MRSATRKKLGKDPAYLQWLHTLVCVRCSYRYPGEGPDLSMQLTPTEAAHIGPRGLSTKVPDRQAIPLCQSHHEQLHKLGPREFWKVHDATNPEAIIKELNERYDIERVK